MQIPSLVKHLINGELVASQNGQTFSNVNPATNEKLCEVALGGKSEIEAAVDAAKRALAHDSWKNSTQSERATLLRRIGDEIQKRTSELARIESLDTGKPISETTKGDIARAAYNFHFYSELCAHQTSPSFRGDDGSLHTSIREPLGVVGLITPWNLPLYLATWKLAPALAQGNTIVLKPAELTPLSAYFLYEVFEAAGLPKGVVNIVQGHGPNSAGEALTKHPDVKAISFTGETTTGAAIMSAGAATLKKMSFELGGKGVSIIFPDANLEKAAKVAARAAMRNQGQVCLAGSRLLVHESVKDKVVQTILSELKNIRVGDPLSMETTMGSLISLEHRERVNEFVVEAEKSGARILTGGHFAKDLNGNFKNGAFYAPTLIDNVKQTDRIIQDEVFGPVLTVQTFKTPEEAVELANGTRYGLSASVWSQDIDLANDVAAQLRFGLVWINAWFIRNLHTAFGGMKKSGVGREGGQYSLDFFCEMKTISAANQRHPKSKLVWI